MISQQYRNLLRDEPFKPFTVHLADGRSFAVDHPEFTSLSPSGRLITVWDKDGAAEIIDQLLVTSVAVRNGTSRRKRKDG